MKEEKKIWNFFTILREANTKKAISHFDRQVFGDILRKIHKRQSTRMIQPVCYGVCVPGLQRLFVDVDGNFYPCERIPGTSSCAIGSVRGGFDLDKIRKLFENLERLVSELQCHRCWAIRLCTTCFTALRAFQDTEESWNYTIRKNREFCSSNRKTLVRYLRYYTQILKTNPEILDEISETTQGGQT